MKRSDIPPTRDQALSLLKTALIEKKLTQFQLADDADCHEKTIQNLLAGRSVREQTLFDVCMVLDLNFESIRTAWMGADTAPIPTAPSSSGFQVGTPGIAPLYMGGYTRDAVDHYIGGYLTIRPALDGSADIIAFRTEFFWSDIAHALCFREQDRPDAAYSHRGHLYIPSSSMFIHLVSLTKGAMRMVLVSQIDQMKRMRGIITTLNKAMGAAFTPVAAPIVYELHDDFSKISFGAITPDHKAYRRYKELLDETVAQSYARLVGGLD